LTRSDRIDIDVSVPPFDQFRSVRPLATNRSGHDSFEHARHHLYVGHHTRTRASALIKVMSKPGLVYEHNLTNEIASLTTIGRELPTSRYFPVLLDHGRLDDGRLYLTMSLFDEFPLATSIGTERMPTKVVTHLRTAIEVAKAVSQLHRVGIIHVDLNPMNILHRAEKGRPVIRIVDFESSYEATRYSTGAFYDPPTTTGYSAPEVSSQPPDARADVYSLGAVLYSSMAGTQWTWQTELGSQIEADHGLDAELKRILLTASDVNPDRRHASMPLFQDALTAHLEHIWPGRSS
jgi:serine/threonine protein kinase